MKSPLYRAQVIVKKSSVHGYGVFAQQHFKPGDLIEECPVLLQLERNTELKNYYFNAGELNGIPLGFACIYNHSNQPNAAYTYDEDHQLMIFRARAPIYVGEEIFTFYGDHWFSSRNMHVRESLIRVLRHYTRPLTSSFRFGIVLAGIMLTITLLRFFTR